MRQFHELMHHVLEHGAKKSDRTGTGTLSVFGYQMRFDLSEGFPLVTTKKLHLKSIIYELLWFLNGNTNNQWLKDRGVSIWDEWAAPNGDLGVLLFGLLRAFFAHDVGVRDVPALVGGDSMEVDGAEGISALDALLCGDGGIGANALAEASKFIGV